MLMREAFALYFRHLAPGGALAVHVTNKHLELAAVVNLLAVPDVTDDYSNRFTILKSKRR